MPTIVTKTPRKIETPRLKRKAKMLKSGILKLGGEKVPGKRVAALKPGLIAKVRRAGRKGKSVSW